jgi:predicted ATPase/class 3 adenylate cyclase
MRPSGTVTFLFTDVEGSTPLWEREPEAMQSGLARHDQIMRSVLASHGGHVFSTAGDAFAAAFASPFDAVNAALAIQAAFAAEKWPTSSAIRVRIGLHSGTADERDGDYFGPTLNRAARIMGVAGGGEVLASTASAELARDLTRGGISFVDLGVVELKGIGTERVFGVVAPGQEPTFVPQRAAAVAIRLPSLATSFIGRELELVELMAALPAGRLMTLVGPGGVGKTRLAIEAGWAAAHAFSGGVWLAELAPIREPGAVAHTLVTALEVRPLPGRTPLEALASGLADADRLVVVDNCEHLLGEVAAVLRQLVEHCPSVRFLATSRAPLAVPGERVWPVDPLPPATSGVALFRDRATAGGAHLGTADAEGTVRLLCERLDGMPLAIELAAARARTMTPAELLAHLADRFRLLRATRRDGDDRHTTLRATMDWSYQLIDQTAQHVFDSLGVFAGAVELAAVGAVAGDEQLDELDVLDALTTLVDHSLVVAEIDSGTTRYRLLDTMRAYAREHLAAHNSLDRTARMHAEWAAERVAALNDALIAPDDLVATDAIADMERFWPDLRAAVTFALDEHDVDLVGRLLGHFTRESLFRERDELTAWLEAAFALPALFDDPRACALLATAATLDWRAGRYESMNAHIAQGVQLRNAGFVDPHDELSLDYSVSVAMAGRLAEARALMQDRLERLQNSGVHSFDLELARTVLAMYECYDGQPERALDTLATVSQLRNPSIRCIHGWVTTMALLDLDPAAAITPGREIVDMARTIKMTLIVDIAANYLTAALAAAGDTAESLETMRSVLEHTASGGGVQSLANTARNAIVLFARLERSDTAAVVAGWLETQTAVLPGTAGMRARAAEAEQLLAATLGAERLARARTRGATMSTAEMVAFLLEELDMALVEVTTT